MTQNTTSVLSYAIYMANAWSKNEAITVFGNSLGQHIWEKWCTYNSMDCANAASMKLIYELDTNNLDKLVSRANELYDGRKSR